MNSISFVVSNSMINDAITAIFFSVHKSETTETWTGRLLRFFEKSYLIDIGKYCTNII